MINIFLDPYELCPEETLNSDIKVTQIPEYANTLLQIKNYFSEESDLRVHVTHGIVCQWLRRYLNRYDLVSIHECTPEAMIKQIWEVDTLPPELDSQTIVKLKLLEYDKPVGNIDDVKSYILGQSVAHCWSGTVPSWNHIGEVISWYLMRSGDEKLENPLQDWIRDKQNQLIEASRGDLRLAYDWLFKNPFEHAKLAAISSMINRYPQDIKSELTADLKENILPTYVDMNKLPLTDLPSTLLSSLNAKVKIYWRRRLINSPQIDQVLDEMSGQLLGEIESLFQYLTDNLSQYDQSIIPKLNSRFETIPEAKVLIESLDVMFPKVNAPSAPDVEGNWDWHKWLKWAYEEYIPYRSEVQSINKQDPVIEKYEGQYEEWLYSKYPELLLDPETPVIHGINKLINKIIAEGYVVLWVIVDNLSWTNSQNFIRYMEEEKLFIVREPEARLSLLPSETSISKSSLVSGQLPRDIPTGLDYEKMLQDTWGEESVKYARTDSDLVKKVTYDMPLYVYMYDDLDELAHSRLADRDSLIQHSLKLLTKKIKNIVTFLMTKSNVRVVVSSDHGSVYLADNAYKANRPNYSELDEKHARFAKIENTSGLDNSPCHILKANNFCLGNDYIIARGYSYIEIKPRAMTHGGMTPEETIVAHLEFSLEKPSWIPLMIAYRGSRLDIGREQKIELVIENPNTIALSSVKLRILSHNLETEALEIPPENEITTSPIYLSFPHDTHIGDDETIILETSIIYDVFGSIQSQYYPLKLPVNRLWQPSGGDLFKEIS